MTENPHCVPSKICVSAFRAAIVTARIRPMSKECYKMGAKIAKMGFASITAFSNSGRDGGRLPAACSIIGKNAKTNIIMT